jgi:uncharacterized protein involved in exopolysaccharide biosynthesis
VIRFLDEFFGHPDAGTSEFQRSRRSLNIFLDQRSIARVGRTYVIDIGFTSLSPEHAASIANGIADAYIVDQLEAKYEATRRASVWLQERIKELRSQASAADLLVLEYKEKNNIVDTGGGPGPNGTGSRLIGDQQVSELSTQGNARACRRKRKQSSILDEMKKDNLPDAAVADPSTMT